MQAVVQLVFNCYFCWGAPHLPKDIAGKEHGLTVSQIKQNLLKISFIKLSIEKSLSCHWNSTKIVFSKLFMLIFDSIIFLMQ